ncbi:MAG: hypothetical protein GXP09_08740 [Gammaproteobacteria bacterium]|nr:hypothetical protein [Gammaproteobacteria bacterium]
MVDQDTLTDSFEIIIDFKPGEGDPARVFKTMSGLIDALQKIDRHLLSTMSVSMESTLILEGIEKGSLKAKFRDLIEGVPDEALKDGEIKRILGYFLLKSKYKIIEWCGERKEVSDRKSVKVLEGELLKIAEETDVKRIPAYLPPSTETLLSDINAVQESLSNLESDDNASYSYRDGITSFNKELNISNEIVRQVLTKEVIASSGIRILKVKKPDYLGSSMWQFRYESHAIEAKILQEEWLQKFQSRTEEVRPGDSLKVELKEEIFYGYEGEVVYRHYEIIKVISIINTQRQKQIDF